MALSVTTVMEPNLTPRPRGPEPPSHRDPERRKCPLAGFRSAENALSPGFHRPTSGCIGDGHGEFTRGEDGGGREHRDSTDRAGRDKRDNAELVDTWYSEGNFARRDRAIALGKELGASPIHIALAYVLAQPFPSIPLIGPRRLQELDDSIKALSIRLTPEQVQWLENG